MRIRFTSRWALVAIVAIGQLVLLVGASIWLATWLDMTIRQMAPAGVTDQIIDQVRWVAISLMLIVVIASTLLTALLVHHYDSVLAGRNVDLEKLVERRSRALLKSRSAVIMGLAMLAESRDGETGQHLERIRTYVRILGDELARQGHPLVDPEFVQTLEETSVLHDIGKVGVPDGVLNKPALLDDEQRSIIQKHPLIGGDTLLAITRQWGEDPFLVTACEVCFSHHERWDGTGYPFGLSGDTIPIAGRIVALADVYDALTTERRYKAAMSHDEARDLIVAGSGTQFDPMVVEAFEATESDFRRAKDRLSMQD